MTALANAANKGSFHWVDYLVLGIYLLFTLGIGLYFKFKSKLQKAERGFSNKMNL